MQEILVLKGLPASGKSTYARQLVNGSQGRWKRVNKDELRKMIDDGRHSSGREALIQNYRDAIIKESLAAGKNVVVDDTNFHPSHLECFNKIAEEATAAGRPTKVSLGFFNVEPNECIQRDKTRPDFVGERVIRRMLNEWGDQIQELATTAVDFSKDIVFPPTPEIYSPPIGGHKAILCDLDGTLALHNGRDPYAGGECASDSVNEPVRAVLEWAWRNDILIILVSARPDTYREQTIKWLNSNGIDWDALFMRRAADKGRDELTKLEIFDKHIRKNYNVLFVLDDRNRVVDLWRRLGLTCFQVASGNF